MKRYVSSPGRSCGQRQSEHRLVGTLSNRYRMSLVEKVNRKKSAEVVVAVKLL